MLIIFALFANINYICASNISKKVKIMMFILAFLILDYVSWFYTNF